MPTSPVLAYPSKEDIGYALWLKHFAIQLPAYASRYDLSPLQVLEVQCVAGEFIDLLIQRMHSATVSIISSQQHLLAPADYQCIINEAECHEEYDRVLRNLVEKVVTHIRRHPAYSTTGTPALDLFQQLPLVLQ